MKAKTAMDHLNFIIDNQQTVRTKKIRRLIKVISRHHKMLEIDNRRMRNKVKRLRKDVDNE